MSTYSFFLTSIFPSSLEQTLLQKLLVHYFQQRQANECEIKSSLIENVGKLHLKVLIYCEHIR